MRKAIVTDHSVSSKTLCDAQIWSILHENTWRDSGLRTVTAGFIVSPL